jgi:hypothetical protein
MPNVISAEFEQSQIDSGGFVAPSPLNDADISRCLQLCRLALNDAVHDSLSQKTLEDIPQISFDAVNVTVYVAGVLRASMAGRGETLEGAIIEACRRAARDERFGPRLNAEDLFNARLDFWIQHDGADVAQADEIRLGLDGVELSDGSRSAYYKPSVALTSAITNSNDLLNKLAKKARLSPDWHMTGQTTIRRTYWEHYAEVPGKSPQGLHLRRLRPVGPPNISPIALNHAAALAAQRLVNVQTPGGFYCYSYHAFKNAASAEPGNLVRQAGCAFAMASAAKYYSRIQIGQSLADSAERAIDFLLADQPSEASCLFEPGSRTHRLGTSALALAALQRGRATPTYEKWRETLRNGILGLQRDDGSFRCTNNSATAEDDGNKQDYYPGEALMALVCELRSGFESAREPIRKAFSWYRSYFRRRQRSGFVLWHAIAWYLMARWSIEAEGPNNNEAQEYASFVFELADWILPFQLVEAKHDDDLVGGFSFGGGEPNYSTASFTEAVIQAYVLAAKLGKTNFAENYLRASQLGLRFLSRLQISPETTMLFRNPAYTIGATTKSLSDFTIRCDFDQHAITAYLAALEAPGLL